MKEKSCSHLLVESVEELLRQRDAKDDVVPSELPALVVRAASRHVCAVPRSLAEVIGGGEALGLGRGGGAAEERRTAEGRAGA